MSIKKFFTQNIFEKIIVIDMPYRVISLATLSRSTLEQCIEMRENL